MMAGARATAAIAAVTALVSIVAMAIGGGGLIEALAFIPARLSGLVDFPGALPAFLTPLSATLLHGGALHLGLNLLMLVWVGAQVERVLGSGSILFAYVVGAFVSALAQWLVDPASMIPMIGASGAISALFGIYALMFGTVKPLTRSASLNRAIHAAWLLGAWIVIQWMTTLIADGEGMMLATPAHIGGFIAGLLLQRPLLLRRYRSA